MTDAQIDRLARKIANHLFTGANGESATALLLANDRIESCHKLGGWGKHALGNVAYDFIREAIPRKPKVAKK